MKAFVRFFTSAACLCACWPGLAAPADEPAVTVRVPEQPLDDALEDLRRQTKLIYMLVREQDQKVPASTAIDGSFPTAIAAVEAMLTCTGYSYKPRGPNRVLVQPTSDEVPDKQSCIVVSGRRTQDSFAERAQTGPLSYVILDKRKLEHPGAENAAAAIGYLPSAAHVFGASTVPGVRDFNLGGIANTRVLVDGRARLGVNVNGDSSGPDILSIPTSAIERVEIFPSTGSAIYGGSNPGGPTINIVLSRACDGGRVKVEHGNSFMSGAAVQRVYATQCLSSGENQLLMTAAYSDQESTRLGDRGFTQRAREDVLVSHPGFLQSPNALLLGAQPNLLIFGASPDESFVTTLSPAEIAAKDASAAFANAGHVSTALADSAQVGGARAAFLDGQVTRYLDVGLKRAFSDSVSTFFDLAMSKATTHTPVNAADSANLHSVFVRPDAPGNFLGVPFVASIPASNADGDLRRELTFRQLTATLDYVPRPGWKATLDATASDSTFEWSQPLATPLAEALAANTINVLEIGSYDFSQWMERYFSSPLRSKAWQATARLSGGWKLTPISSLTFTGVLERSENFFDSGREMLQGSSDPQPRTVAELSRQEQFVDSAALEVAYRKSTFGWHDVSSLELRAAGRADRYDKRTNVHRCTPDCSDLPDPTHSTYTSVNPSLAVIFKPIPSFGVRGSYGTGFRIPTSNESSAAVTRVFPASVIPGLSANSSDLVLITVGGNPGVEPEKLNSWSAGVVLEPSLLPGFTLTFDHNVIKKRREIVTPVDLLFEDFPRFRALYPDSVDNNLSPSNSFGANIAIDARARNIAQAESRSWDASVEYKWPVVNGLQASLQTRVSSQRLLRRRAAPTTQWDDYTGLTSTVPNKLGVLNELTLRRNALSAGLIMRYMDGYKISTSADAIQATVSSQLYHDVYVSYRLRDLGFLGMGADVQLGVTNLFNRSPRIDITQQRGLVSSQDDPRMRSYLASVTAHF